MAILYLDESRDIYKAIGDKQGLAYNLQDASTVAFRQKNFDQAFDFLREALLLKRELGEKRALAHTLNDFSRLNLQFAGQTPAKANPPKLAGTGSPPGRSIKSLLTPDRVSF